MLWVNHKLTTGAVVYFFTGNMTATILAVIASVWPDWIEYPFGPNVKHRTITHWPYPPIFIFGIIYFFWIQTGDFAFYYAMFLPIGWLLHLATDFMSIGGIPFGKPTGTRVGISLYKTRTEREYLVVLAIILPCLFFIILTGKTTPEYLKGEVTRIWILTQFAAIRFF